MKKLTTNSDLKTPRHKLNSFTYVGKEAMYITKLFKHTLIKIAYRTNYSIEINRKPEAETTNKFLAGGI
jgi:hypothetical protein